MSARWRASAGLSVGIMSATQGAYTREQLLLDIGQGARIATSAYRHRRLPRAVAGARLPARSSPAGKRRSGAREAPAAAPPGPARRAAFPAAQAYAGYAGAELSTRVAAADRHGHVAAVSLGSASNCCSRASRCGRSKRLVVCDLPGGTEGLADLRALSRSAARGRAAARPAARAEDGGDELLWAAAAGLRGGGGHELTSHTTNQRGLIAAVDLAPTILEHLGLGRSPPTCAASGWKRTARCTRRACAR